MIYYYYYYSYLFIIIIIITPEVHTIPPAIFNFIIYSFKNWYVQLNALMFWQNKSF